MESLTTKEDFPTVRFKNAVNVKDLMSTEGTTFEINLEDFNEEERDDENFDADDLKDVLNLDCLGLQDEDCYQNEEPFEMLSKKMEDLIPGGGIKKRIIRKGVGEVIPENSVVYIDYNGYLEYNDTPFDSTYLRKKTQVFRVGQGETLIGLDIGVASMKVNEKSQFLLQPDFAYGKLGCLNRVPANSTVLFEIELIKFIDSGAATTYANLDAEQQNKYEEIYKHALALAENARDLVTTKKNYKAAIREYNIAVTKLENCQLLDYDQQESQQKLLLRLYTNLSICYNKVQQPRKACINCNKIFYMCRGTSLIIPTKVFYNNAKALMMLNDLPKAEKRLRQAAQRDRDNVEIVRCFVELNKLKEEKKERDKMFAKMLVGNSNVVSEEFKLNVKGGCKDIKDGVTDQFELPEQLTVDETNFVRDEAKRNGLDFQDIKKDDVKKFKVCKFEETKE